MVKDEGKRSLSDDEDVAVEEEEKPAKKMKSGKECGTLLFSGLTDYTQRNKDYRLLTDVIKWGPHQYTALKGIRFREVLKSALAYFSMAISDEGKLYAWGLNKKGQLCMGDNCNRNNPTLVTSMQEHNVVAVAAGRQHCLILTDTGDVYACGDNELGQIGLGTKQEVNMPMKIDNTLMGSVKQVRCGDDFSLFLTTEGKVFACGTTEDGRLGVGREERDIGAGKETFICVRTPEEITLFVEKDEGEVISHGQPTITQIDCGLQHSCALDDQQRLFTWGHGGYGRLGHNSTSAELRPRLMKCWYRTTGRADGGVVRMWCGGQFTFVDTTAEKCKLMFGQYDLKKDANMYPKLMDDLSGWDVRDIACGCAGFLICADDSVIGCQPPQGSGQLAMGPTGKKTSARPMIIETLNDVYVLRVGRGYMHSAMIVRDTAEKDRTALEKFPKITMEDSNVEEEDEEEEEPVTKKKKGKQPTKKQTNKKKATKAKGKMK